MRKIKRKSSLLNLDLFEREDRKDVLFDRRLLVRALSELLV
jgi:hypothetical protein